MISVEQKRIFKPSPQAYDLIEETLSVKPANVLFVSSNAFDTCGAKSYGLPVAWIERVTAEALHAEVAGGAEGPATLFKILRMRMEHLGLAPDHVLQTLSDIPAILGA